MFHSGAAGYGAQMQDAGRKGWGLERLALLWGRIRHRDPVAYEGWLQERDVERILGALLRLDDRQLKRIGMSRATLALDVELLTMQVARSQMLGQEALELVGGTDAGARVAPRAPAAPPHREPIAAE